LMQMNRRLLRLRQVKTWSVLLRQA
jgi:hypothetical protein